MSDPILTDEEIERLKNQKGGIEFGAGSNIISGGNLPSIDYGDIAGQIFAQQPRDLGIDLNANRDALDALVDAGLVDLGSMGIMGAMPSMGGSAPLGLFSTDFDPNTQDTLKEDWIAAGEELAAHNQKFRGFDITDPQFKDETDPFFEEQKKLQDNLQKARSAFIAAGGDPDGLTQKAIAAAAGGIAGAANVLPQIAGGGTFQQVAVSPGTITGTFDPQGPRPLIPIGKDGDTTVVTSTGVPAIDDAVNTVLGGESVATADVPTIGEIGGAAGDLIGGGLEQAGKDVLGLPYAEDKDIDGTDVVLGGAGMGTPSGVEGAVEEILSGDSTQRRQQQGVDQPINRQVDPPLPDVDPPLGGTPLDVKGDTGTAPDVKGDTGTGLDVKGDLPVGPPDGPFVPPVGPPDGPPVLPPDLPPEVLIETPEDIIENVEGDGSNRGGDGSLFLPQSFRGVREEPGDLVDIDYLYDFDDGLEQLFAATDDDEEEIEKGLYVYEEGGEVAKQDAVDMVTRRPGEYGRTYFDYGTPSAFTPTGLALGGESLTSSEIQIPEYNYNRTLKPEFRSPSVANTGATGTTFDFLDTISETGDTEGSDMNTLLEIVGLLGMPGLSFAQGGMAQGYYLGGPTDGMADLIPATIDGTQPAALSDGEFVIPADVVSHLGNGNSDAGAEQLYSMMDRVRDERTGTTKQGPEIDPTKMMPA
jgi:hypothetical protein